MSSNQFLKELHLEKLRRQNPKQPEQNNENTRVDKAVGADEPFCCAVCYTDGASSGLVTPTCCSHKICLECYTKITIINKDKASCPECRTLYIKKEEEKELDEYADMPPLISPHELINDYTFEEEAMSILNNAIAINAINAINAIYRNNIIIHRI